MPRGKARQYASDVDEWGTGALWGARLGGGKRGNVLPVHLECWVPRFPSWCELNNGSPCHMDSQESSKKVVCV